MSVNYWLVRYDWHRFLKGATYGPLRLVCDLFARERPHWFLWFPVGVGIGVGLYFSLPIEPPFLVSVFLFGIGLFLVCVSMAQTYIWNRPSVGFFFLSFAVLSIVTGFFAGSYRTNRLNTPLIIREYGPLTLVGTVIKSEEMTDARRLTLTHVDILSADDRDGIIPPLNQIRISFRGRVRGTDSMEPGDQVEIRAKLLPPSGPLIPGGYNFRRKAYFDGISAVGYGVKPPILRQKTKSANAASRLQRLRHLITEKLRTALPGDSGGVAAALVTGDRSGLSDDIKDAFSGSGLSHILAISGLHLSIVAGLAFFTFRRGLTLIPFFALRYPLKKIAAVLAILLTFFYLLLSDLTLPAQRSFMMVSLILLGVLTDRRALTLRNVALAALVILAFQPESLLSPSFQLSFAAVTALVAGYEGVQKTLTHLQSKENSGIIKRIILYGVGITFSSILATIATTPFTVFTFNRFTCHAIEANLLAIPLLSYGIMPGLVLFGILDVFSAGALIAPALSWMIGLLIDIGRTVSQFPGSLLLAPFAPVGVLATLTLGGLWLCLWTEKWRFLGLVPMAASIMMWASFDRPHGLLIPEKNFYALQGPTGKIQVNSRQSARFARTMWIRMLAQKDTTKLTDSWFQLKEHRIFCDDINDGPKSPTISLALTQSPGRIALSRSFYAPKTMELAAVSYDLHRKSGYFWVRRDGAVHVHKTRDSVGNRPWS